MSETGERTRFEPPVGEHDEALWAATRDGRAPDPLVPRLRASPLVPAHRLSLVPRSPHRGAGRRRARASSTPSACSTARDGPAWPTGCPTRSSLVDLAEGVRLTGNLVAGDDAGEVAVGTPVRLAWEPLSDGRQLPVFAVA